MAFSKNTSFTHRQLRALHAAARQAYDSTGGDSTHGPYEAWRRTTIQECTGATGFSQCRQSHYSTLMAHFQHMQGQDGAALQSLLHAGVDCEVKQAQTAWHLDRAAREIGYYLDPIDPIHAGRHYAISIAQDQFPGKIVTWEILLQHDYRALERLIFTLQARRRALAEKASADADVAEFEPEDCLDNCPF